VLELRPMTNIAEAIADLDRRIADVESNMATVRREIAAHAVPRHMLNWLLDFVAVADGKLEELRGRRAELQRRRDNSAQMVHEESNAVVSMAGWSSRPPMQENGRGVTA
jgi:hypothetical protein